MSVGLSDCPTCGQVGCSEAPDHKTELHDTCYCGDWRDQHPNDGPCSLNGLGHGIPRNEPGGTCQAFRFSRTERRLKHTKERWQ